MRGKSTGRCLCGSLQFEVRGKPLWVAHCHCRSCRRNTGSAVATFVGFRKDQLTYTCGERKFYASSAGVQRGFCAECGTPMTYEADRWPGEVHVYVATLDNPDDFRPQLHVFFAERISWLELEDDLPRYEGLARGAQPLGVGPLKPALPAEDS
ncbi:MAG: GFA family protein [Gammaproteobacteria bacterium]|nr:GFA family protein [Gammaproteobacteria bacterium]NIV49703.1 GFA family protein [Gammaproteobacteria bacterium]NIW57101.1 GFA family protein [Gammaproteobacteria bacterium]